jgi:hypothetical protein
MENVRKCFLSAVDFPNGMPSIKCFGITLNVLSRCVLKLKCWLHDSCRLLFRLVVQGHCGRYFIWQIASPFTQTAPQAGRQLQRALHFRFVVNRAVRVPDEYIAVLCQVLTHHIKKLLELISFGSHIRVARNRHSTTTGHTGRIIIRIRPQHRHFLNSL